MSDIRSTPETRSPRIRGKHLLLLLALLLLPYVLVRNTPVEMLDAQTFALRQNRWTGSVGLFRDEARVWVLPGVHELRRYPLAAVDYSTAREGEASSGLPLQSSDGLPVDLPVSIHYRVDPARLVSQVTHLPDDLQVDLVAPLVDEVLRRQVATATLAGLFNGERVEFQRAVETALREGLAQRGFTLHGVEIGEAGLRHKGQRLSLQDRSYVPQRISSASGAAPLQSSEGLSLGLELAIRYALDAANLAGVVHRLPDDLDAERVDPLLQGVIYKVLARYTVREIFSTKRQALQQEIEAELGPLMAQDGLLLRSVMLGNVDLPQDYRAGMDRLLAAELANQQMEHTLELKAKQVKETELQAEAEKVRREKAAEAAGREQVIAAKAQEEAMRHVLPFKQKQVEQRQLEAEAERTARVKTAEGMAEARRIEASAEADSRRKLADAEVYRLEQVGQVNSEQLRRDGELVSRYPLLIQKTMADKLSDKISVIIAAPPADGGFIGSGLLGQGGASPSTADADAPTAVRTSNRGRR